jgi:hypothetical protein
MVIKSLVRDERYIWLRVPRTATYSYGKLFFPETKYEHSHNSYYHETDKIGELLPAFSVVRNPYTRFVSSLKHMVKRQKQNGKIGRWNFYIPMENIEILSEWIFDNMDLLKSTDNEARDYIKNLFKTDDITFVKLFFAEQVHFVNFPGVSIFKFEALTEYNKWIQDTLGYETKFIQHLNSSSDELQHLDFQNVNFIKIVEQFFYEDYTVFKYPFQHLT